MPEVSEAELCECGLCGAKSAWVQGFVKTRTLVRGTRATCVTCWLYRSKYRDAYVRWASWAAILVLAGYYVTESAVSAVLFALGLYATSYLAVVVHELGHAAVALALGFRISAFSLGGGLHVKVIAWRNTFVLLGPSPVEGLVALYPPSPRHYRKKMALVLVAGSAVNVLCGALGLLWLAADGSTFTGLLASLWIGVNFVLVLNLLPVVSNGSFGPLRSDGLQLLELLKVGDDEIARRLADARLTEATLAFYYGALEQAHALVAPLLGASELQGKGRVLATAVLIGIGKTQEGIELARRFLDAGDGTPEERAVLMNNLAWALVDPADGSPAPARVAEADALSMQALAVVPMANAVRGTRGAVLVAKGQYREAVGLLTDKRFRLEPAWTRATVKATLALALAGLGETEQAARTLAEAARLDPGNRQLARARERVMLPPADALSYDTPTRH